ncbi:hypothetical protein [Caballeronia sp. LZ034LL]|uniref:hypothetical protein n=1 Tax=Caballeronia sp. LZ034LL TaxID=3038567 RepID=UPI00285C6A01|nr:hypothetical protein [Caballeronia sp. LZ034LL]MDR5839344.1 hypothetical protein [Caballeronia sp. LZ034LL]
MSEQEFEKSVQSELLTKFYQAYVKWLDEGAPIYHTFDRHHGLCMNLKRWSNRYAQVEYGSLIDEMARQLEDVGLGFLHPFNDNSFSFNYEADRGESHLNPKRIQWVRDHAQL